MNAMELNAPQLNAMSRFCMNLSQGLVLGQLLGSALIGKPTVLVSLNSALLLGTAGLLFYIGVVLLQDQP